MQTSNPSRDWLIESIGNKKWSDENMIMHHPQSSLLHCSLPFINRLKKWEVRLHLPLATLNSAALWVGVAYLFLQIPPMWEDTLECDEVAHEYLLIDSDSETNTSISHSSVWRDKIQAAMCHLLGDITCFHLYASYAVNKDKIVMFRCFSLGVFSKRNRGQDVYTKTTQVHLVLLYP